MARLPRLYAPNLPHHVLQRSAAGTQIAQTADDYLTLHGLLCDSARVCGVSLHGYVLMSNHFHLLATPANATALPRMMQAIARRYSQYFNRRYGRRGTLWEGRYRSTILEVDRYFLMCLRYIELNPCRLGLVADPGHYPWSSYRHHIGLESQPGVTDHAAYWALGNTPFERQAAYHALFDLALKPDELTRLREATQHGWALGDPEFVERLSFHSNRRAAPLTRGRPKKRA